MGGSQKGGIREKSGGVTFFDNFEYKLLKLHFN